MTRAQRDKAIERLMELEAHLKAELQMVRRHRERLKQTEDWLRLSIAGLATVLKEPGE